MFNQSGSHDNEGVLCISQSSKAEASPSDSFVSNLRHLLGESYPSAEMQSVYPTAPTNCTTGHSLGESYSSAEIQSVYSTAPTNCATGQSLGESYLSAEMQSVYSTASTDKVRYHLKTNHDLVDIQ